VARKSKQQAIILSQLEEVLLTLLYSRSLYGLEFVNAIKKASNGEREIGFGSLYPTLTRMEKKGLVSWRWGDEQSGPRRKYYDITPYGKQAIDEEWRFRERLRALSIDVAAEDLEVPETSDVKAKLLTPTE
jgi:PadR family transcriptional regulator PadR